MDPDGDGDDDEPLIDALMDARDGCGTVAGTASGALWTFFDGDPDYSSPLLEAFVKQAQALIVDLNVAIAEAQKEIVEPNEGGEARKVTSLDRIDRMAYLESD